VLDAPGVRKHEARDEQDVHDTPRAARGTTSREPELTWAAETLDAARYLNSLLRSGALIATVVVALTGSVLLLSFLLPKSYQATASIVLEEQPGELTSGDVERRLFTINTLVTTQGVLARAARRLQAETTESLQSKVSSSVDARANIIKVTATDTRPAGAAAIANATANGFLAQQRAAERRSVARTRATLIRAIARLRGSRAARSEIEVLRERLSELTLLEASSGTELQLAEAARAPATPSSPRPVRNALFAFAAAVFIAVLVAVGREHLAPRVSSATELVQLSGLPVLARLPGSRRLASKTRMAAVVREAYQSLAALVTLQLPPSRQYALLVTSAHADEGKTEVAANLGPALAQAGENTLLVSGDLRRPALDGRLGIDQRSGLAEILSTRGTDPATTTAKLTRSPEHPRTADQENGSLVALGSGRGPANPVRLLSPGRLDAFFKGLARTNYRYVVIEGPPLLGAVECRYWLERVDAVVVVSTLERLSPDAVREVRQLLERYPAPALGHVVIDATRVL